MVDKHSAFASAYAAEENSSLNVQESDIELEVSIGRD
jgi:hypothetical protein